MVCGIFITNHSLILDSCFPNPHWTLDAWHIRIFLVATIAFVTNHYSLYSLPHNLNTMMSQRSLATTVTRRLSPRLLQSLHLPKSSPTIKLVASLQHTHHPITSLQSRSFSEYSPAKTSKDGVVGIPIDFDISTKIEGNESQIVTITLEPGQVLRAESGAMMYMTNGVQMNTTTGGGLSSGFQRMLTGQNFFISDYTYEGPPGTTGTVALGTDFPSKILRLNVDEYGGKIVCQKGALLCASHTIDIEMEFTKSFAGGFFGGEGFVLQALTGEGDVFLKAGGTLIRRELDDGEQLRISSGCLVGFSQGVDYDVQMVQGFKNVFAGGEGLFMTTLTGPGVVWLQGQPPQRMISEISRRVPSGGGLGFVVPVGGGGGGGSGGESGGSGGESSSSQ